MIRFARKEDLFEVRRLWGESFGDDDFAQWYFDYVYKEENTLVYEYKSGELVAMLARIPYKISNFGQVTYIYGACTDIRYRRRGIMRELLLFSEKIDRDSGIAAIILIPENEELFNFYDKLGYTDYFYRFLTNEPQIDNYLEENYDLFISNNNEKSGLNKGFEGDFYIDVTEVKPFDSKIIYKLNNLYSRLYSNQQVIIRDTEYFKKLVTMYEAIQGKVYIFYDGHKEIKGYAFGYTEKDFKVSELVYENSQWRTEIIARLIMLHKSIKILNELQGNYKIKYGSIKLLQKNKNVNKILINGMFD